MRWFFLTYLVFTASQFVIASNFVYTWLFYLGVGLPCCFLYSKRHELTVSLLKNPLSYCVIGLFSYTILHALALSDDSKEMLDTTRHTLATLVFTFSTALWFSAPERYLRRAYQCLLWVVATVGMASIASHLWQYGAQTRLEALGQNDHAILGANIYIGFALLGFYFLHPDKQRHTNALTRRFLPYIAIAITAFLVILTHSRGPLLSLIACTALGLLLTRHYRTVALCTLLSCIIGLDFYYYYTTQQSFLPFSTLYDAVTHLFNRESHRINIWVIAIDLIKDKPWTGYGMQQGFPYGFGGVNPHNIFLSAWYYTGLLGCIMIITIALYALIKSMRLAGRASGLLGGLLMLHAIIACLTDQGQFVNSPSPLWGFFWLPIGYAIALPFKNNKAS